MSARSTLPTLDEVPAVPIGYGRDDGDFVRLSLVPPDDTALRAATIKIFLAEEHCQNAVSSESDTTWEGVCSLRRGLSDVPARTPGGIAWKLAEVLTYFEDQENWEPWRYLLKSAVVDAIELERARAVDVSSPAASGEPGDLGGLLVAWRRLYEISETCESDDLRNAAGGSAHHIAAAVIKLQSATMAGVMGKMEIVRSWNGAGHCDLTAPLLDSIHADLRRLTEAPAATTFAFAEAAE
jgi:hypothetical protein